MSWLLLLFSIIPQDFVARDSVERLEVNHFYDENGRWVFTQLIGWQQDDHVRFWKMDKDCSLMPTYDHSTRSYVLRFADGDVIREVRARSFGPSWTQWDVELADRTHVPPEHRHPLRNTRK